MGNLMIAAEPNINNCFVHLHFVVFVINILTVETVLASCVAYVFAEFIKNDISPTFVQQLIGKINESQSL